LKEDVRALGGALHVGMSRVHGQVVVLFHGIPVDEPRTAEMGNAWPWLETSEVKSKVQSNLRDDMKYMKCDECISISNTLLCKTEFNLASSTSIKLPAGDSKASNCLPPQKLNSLESPPSCRWKTNPALTQPSN
jgi:hypothetical protein